MRIYFKTEVLEKFRTPIKIKDMDLPLRTSVEQKNALEKYGLIKLAFCKKIPRGAPQHYFVITEFGALFLKNIASKNEEQIREGFIP